ncbi:zinc-dependent metalloprotease [Shewanella maritima]|uniref:zinc-dependent metalloprotease n=1 Tax=Shewanella maritima TaxID=2520507 RepID=UPI003736131D
MRRRSISFALLLLSTPMVMTGAAPALAASEAQTVVKNSVAANGFLNMFYHTSGELYLEANRLNQPFLLLTSLPQGVGSNDIGLDRGQLGYTRMVQFEQQGPYIVLKQLNTDYRASAENLAEKNSVKQAFAESILWRGKLLEGKRAIVNINELVVNDLHGVADRLEATKQGNFRLDTQRSVLIKDSVKSFEKNADVDVNLTFTTGKPGEYVSSVTPDPKFVSVRMRYSFIALPEEGYQARSYHPMSGYLSNSHLDYSVPVDQDITQRYLLRHRLEKVNPGPEPSPVVEPIVYYLDPGVPEPIRTALLDGARWWEDAFNAAGFIDGFQVKMLPEDADPQDIRYNMIQWVHRATRGWSYGAAITDPRTGEIIKGHVTLGSLRVRQDHLIARGLTAGWEDREAAEQAAMDLSLARIRQLSAHEIGHTLGLDHNFAASSKNNASVMDYPHPNVTIEGDRIDISEPYTEGIGPWDKYTIAFGYGDESQQAELLNTALLEGYRYIGEADSRSQSASHVYASLWDTGNDAVAELARLEQVRRKAINEFNADALLQGQPMGELADAFVPIYLLTRYQIQAAAKFVGGTEYSYQQVGSGLRWNYVSPKLQLRALEVLLQSLHWQSLVIPANVVEMLVPKAGNYRKTRESFDSQLGVATDPLAMAEVLGRHVTKSLLNSARLNRVNQAYMGDNEQLSVPKLVDKLLAASLYSDLKRGESLGIQMRINAVVVDELLVSYHHKQTAVEVKAQLRQKLQQAAKQLERRSRRASDYQSAHYDWLMLGLKKGLADPKVKILSQPMKMPPGSPI